MAPKMALGGDLADRQISNTASGILDASGSHRMLVLLLLAGLRLRLVGWPRARSLRQALGAILAR
jgi:hypothetical protein